MMIDANITVAELVEEVPARAQVFEHLGIRYCCGGDVPLKDAVADVGADIYEVITQLEAVTAEREIDRDWSKAELSDLCAHIAATHHERLRVDLPRVYALVTKVARVHGAQHPSLTEAETVFTNMAELLLGQMDAEEREVFALAQSDDFPAAPNSSRTYDFVAALTDANKRTEEDLSKLRSLYNEYVPPVTACNSYRAMLDGVERLEQDIRMYVHKENEILLPRISEALTVVQ